jgi:hypothetical protein
MTTAPYASNVRPIRARGTARVRPFVDADIPQVAQLHRAAFRLGDDPRQAEYSDYFTRVFLDSAAADRGISSLVYQEPDGRIAGFVGIVPRRVTIGGRRHQAAVSSQFIVDPASHVGLVALRLAKAYLEGPQDLSIADEANDVSRRIWEGLGGTTALLLSMYWTRALRPARLGLSVLGRRRALAPLAFAGGPIAALADGLTVRFPGSQLRQTPPSTGAEPLFAQTVVAHAAEVCGDAVLRVEYDEQTFQRILDRTARRAADGRLLNAVVKNGASILGWYVAHVDAAGVAEVAQIAATGATVHDVLDHLFYHAWREGAVSVTGRLDPRFVQPLSDKYCFFHRRGPWVLIKANKPELLHALESGATSLSRFDGEWSLRFHPQGV